MTRVDIASTNFVLLPSDEATNVGATSIASFRANFEI